MYSLLMLMLGGLVKFIINTPVYPHWLEFRNRRLGDYELMPYVRGDVLETGAGASQFKKLLFKKSKKIKSYLVTDYQSWDKIFKKSNSWADRFGEITQLLFKNKREIKELDQIVDALNLPYSNKSFDTYCCFETLEHINEPDKFFSEASRVLRPGGVMVISVPFLYREHSAGTGFDYYRYTKSGLYFLAKKHGLKVTKAFSYSFLGTTMAVLINQFIIRKFFEGSYLVKFILISIMPIIFISTNSVGYLIDYLSQDERFCTRWHVIFTKL